MLSYGNNACAEGYDSTVDFEATQAVRCGGEDVLDCQVFCLSQFLGTSD